MERMYDWSTWRLYHRIVEHREKHPLTTSYFNDPENAVSASRKGAPRSSSGESRSRHASASRKGRASRVQFGKSPLEGEVFELEL
jgi:hypothetical protein